MSLFSMYIRYSFAKGDRKRDAGLKTPEDVERFDDIAYGEDRKYQLLDVYKPKGVKGKLPVILSFHGGGWVYGTKETYQYYCMSLSQRGFAVVNFSYRLAPSHRYPAQIEDCNSAVQWMLEHGEEYGFDIKNVFAVGDSAGGHLLSVYSAMLSDHSYADYYGIRLPKDFRFNAIALNCGVYHQEMPKKKSEGALLNDLLPKGWGEKDLKMLNSYDKIAKGFPPVFVMSSNGDFLRDQVDFLVPELKKQGIEHTVKIYGDADSVLGHVFHVNIRLKEAGVCNDDECAFFTKHMEGAGR